MIIVKEIYIYIFKYRTKLLRILIIFSIFLWFIKQTDRVDEIKVVIYDSGEESLDDEIYWKVMKAFPMMGGSKTLSLPW